MATKIFGQMPVIDKKEGYSYRCVRPENVYEMEQNGYVECKTVKKQCSDLIVMEKAPKEVKKGKNNK